ncbi:hypothetical protein ACVWWG_001611 [Bradyrhizobium sp. LB7.2]
MVTVSFDDVLPKADFFATFDKHFMQWSPEEDALRIAPDLVNHPSIPIDTIVAQRYGWEPRRMNPGPEKILLPRLVPLRDRIASPRQSSQRRVNHKSSLQGIPIQKPASGSIRSST